MGGGASAQKTEINAVDEQITAMQQHNSQLQGAVEEFAEQCYLDGDKPDGLRIILKNPGARKAFIEYLNTENGSENLKFFQDMENMRSLKERKDTDIAAEAQAIVDTYNKPTNPVEGVHDNVSTNISTIMSGTTEENATEENASQTSYSAADKFLQDTSKDVSNETMVFLAFNVFPNFVGSNSYRKWREEEAKAANKTAPTAAAPDAAAPADALVAGTVQYIDKSKIGSIFKYGSWLGAFVAAAEGLPICVTLADASPDNPGFPLIYVNKVFEDTTGHPRERIRNTNCKFLQGPKSEKESIALLSNALANAQPVKVAITNYKRAKHYMPSAEDKGLTPAQRLVKHKEWTEAHPPEMFKNLLAMKPVFDLDGRYCYVVGVQFDISNPGSNAKAMKLVDSLINLLPNVVPTGGSF